MGRALSLIASHFSSEAGPLISVCRSVGIMRGDVWNTWCAVPCVLHFKLLVLVIRTSISDSCSEPWRLYLMLRLFRSENQHCGLVSR